MNNNNNNENPISEESDSPEEIEETLDNDSSPEEESSDATKDEDYIKGLFEAALFLNNDPLPVSFFVKNFSIDPTQAKIILDSLIDEYEERDGGIQLVEISNGFQFMTNSKYASQLRRCLGLKKKESLTRGMLETLSIVAYKQPVTLADVDELRGVSSRMMIANLMKKNLVKPVGRMDLPGRPLTYGTTDEFLRYFGLNKLSDLPRLSEIKEFSIEDESA